jgi:GNAT superfamily N-acetyltransferase
VGIRRHLIPAGHTTVAVVDDLVVGLLAVSTGTDCSRIDQLYLLPAWVGRGIGTRLLELARSELVAPW